MLAIQIRKIISITKTILHNYLSLITKNYIWSSSYNIFLTPMISRNADTHIDKITLINEKSINNALN